MRLRIRGAPLERELLEAAPGREQHNAGGVAEAYYASERAEQQRAPENQLVLIYVWVYEPI